MRPRGLGTARRTATGAACSSEGRGAEAVGEGGGHAPAGPAGERGAVGVGGARGPERRPLDQRVCCCCCRSCSSCCRGSAGLRMRLLAAPACCTATHLRGRRCSCCCAQCAGPLLAGRPQHSAINWSSEGSCLVSTTELGGCGACVCSLRSCTQDARTRMQARNNPAARKPSARSRMHSWMH